MAYSGTMVAAGRGVGVVTATGPATELGRINKMIAEVETLATPLTRQMNRFGQILAVVIVSLAVLMSLVGWLLHDFTTGELFLAAIGFAVAAIPEGLPAILTITLALGVQSMAQRNAITRKLNAIETLGSVTVICSDKTGTLTRNEMTARHVVTRAHRYDMSGTGYQPEGQITCDDREVTLDDHPDLRALVEVMAVCNDSHFTEEDGRWKVTGEPTEGALVALARKAGFDTQGYERMAVIPFESENKFMATLDRVPDGGARILLKGAPDRLLDRCQNQRAADGTLEALDRDFWEQRIDLLSDEGLRVLAAAVRAVDAGHSDLTLDDLERDLVFLGLVGIIDPPRPEAIDAIKACHAAGIQVKMITGDHAGTAKAIGREMGIGDGAHAVTGAELEKASDIGFVSILIGGATIAVFLYEQQAGTSLELARTLAVNTLVWGQAFYLFNSRYLRESSLSVERLFANRVAWLTVGVLAVLQLTFVYAPFMHAWFGSAALGLRGCTKTPSPLAGEGWGGGFFQWFSSPEAVQKRL
jgi:magnesium-transporting ATPase (P-type)